MKKLLNKSSLILLMIIGYCQLFTATIRYVSHTGSNTPPYTSWETSADSIQKCINICVFGDTIYVANGVYEEQVVMIPGLSLIGAGTDSCWIDSRQLITMQNYKTIDMKNNCLVKGFYIRSTNNFDYGYGISAVGQTGLITQNKFSEANIGIDLRASNIKVYKNYFFNIRGGVFMWSSNSIVRKNEIYILTDQAGVGVFIMAITDSYSPLIDSNNIMTIGDGIVKSLGSRPRIINNSISLSGGEGIWLSISDSTYIFNNRIFVKSGGRAIDQNAVPYLQLFNNYCTGNIGDAISILPNNSVKNNVVTNANKGVVFMGSGNFIFHYNDIWNNNINYTGYTPDSTNISLDPMIVNDDTTQGDLDFHLQMFSPLIDTGDPNILDKDSTKSDIGLYGGPYGESYIYIDLPPRSPVNLTAEVDSSIVTLRWNKNTEADFSYYNLFYDTTKNFQIDSTNLISSQTDTLYYFVIPVGVESLYFKLTAIDNQGNESNPSEEVAVILVSVKNEWTPVNNYILYQNYPNPFNPSTKIDYKLKERGYVKLYIYDIKGELVSVLVNEVQEAGYYEVIFDAGYSMLDAGKKTSSSGLASGVYIYQILVSNDNSIPVFNDIKKMLLVK